MYEQRYEHTLRDRVKLILLATIRSAQIIAPIGVIFVMAVYPSVCYNHLDMIIGGLIMWEAGLALVSKLIKNRIWAEALFTVSLITLLWCVVLWGVDFVVDHLFPLFASVVLSRVFGLFLDGLFLVSITIILWTTDRTLKALPISRRYKFCYVFFPGLSALFIALVIVMSVGIINPCVGEVDLRIYFVSLAILSVIVYVLVSTTYHQTRLICKYKDVLAVEKIMSTYNDGSVYVSYPVEDRAIEDLVEYGVFVLRNPKTAKLCGNTGAWYNISKDNYAHWISNQSPTLDHTTHTVRVKIKPRK